MTIRLGIDVHTLGAQQTGNETYIRSLVDALCDLDDGQTERFYYYTRRAHPPKWAGTPRRIWPHVPSVRLLASFPIALLRDRIDVAHFQYVMPPLCPCPAVVAVHDVSFAAVDNFLPPLMRRRLLALVPLALRQSAHVLTISEFSKREILHYFGGDPDHITVAPLAADPVYREIDPDVAVATARDLGAHQPYILAVGKLQPRKNLIRLLRAFAALRRQGRIEHQLVLVGQQGFRGQDVAAEVRTLGLEHAVVLTGYVTDQQLVALYNAADLFVYPSLYEGFGLPVLEAMACGTPVVTSNTTSIPEVAGTAAMLVDPTNVDELADAMDRVLGDDALRAQMRADGLCRAATFSWRQTAERTFAVYQRVHDGANGRFPRLLNPSAPRPNP